MAGVLSAIVFNVLLVVLKPLSEALDHPMVAALLSIGISGLVILVTLGFLRRYVPVRGEAEETRGPACAGGNYSTRVDKVDPNWLSMQAIRAIIALMLAILTLIPVLWMGMTAFKSRSDAVASPPKVIFDPTMEGFIGLLTKRRQLTDTQIEEYQQRTDLNWADKVMLKRGQAIIGQSDYVKRLRNSLIIASSSTVLSVALGVLSAYAFSRFRVPGEGDLLFFILSTRMLPPVVVTIPIFLMYRELGLYDTHIGMILLYTAFNLSFSVWLLKGFIDEIPREYEEAALVDGYTRMQAFMRIVLPQAVTGIAATTVFCFIFAWNEYAFALMLTADNARTAPPSIPSDDGKRRHRVGGYRGGVDGLPDPGCDRDFCAAAIFAARGHVRRNSPGDNAMATIELINVEKKFGELSRRQTDESDHSRRRVRRPAGAVRLRQNDLRCA